MELTYTKVGDYFIPDLTAELLPLGIDGTSRPLSEKRMIFRRKKSDNPIKK